jgi:hypothetical protein
MVETVPTGIDDPAYTFAPLAQLQRKAGRPPQDPQPSEHEARIIHLQRLLDQLAHVRQQTIELITETADDRANGRPRPNRKRSTKRKRR